MADLASITAVRPTANTIIKKVTYGATIAAGQTVYLDTTDNEYKLADANGSETTAKTRGIAVTPGVDAGYGYIATGGDIILVGTTMAVGGVYVQSGTAGGIAPEADLVASDYVTTLGIATTATQLNLKIQISGTQHA